jgi:NAD(P)-dependent dehydrogenase (short-subunit alcohol dehydrogenase family)
VIADMNEARGQQLVKEIEAQSGAALFVKTDVRSVEQTQNMVEQALAKFDRLDFAVNSAGISGETNILAEHTLEGWDQVIGINLNGVFYSMRAEIPALLKSGGGAIVNIASIMGLISMPQIPGYVAAKHGVVGLTKSAAQAYSAQGIRTNAICPGYIETPMMTNSLPQELQGRIGQLHPIGRIGKPEEIAATALFLCSDDASFITGGIYPVDGGYVAN